MRYHKSFCDREKSSCRQLHSTVKLHRPRRKSERQLDKTHQKLMFLFLYIRKDERKRRKKGGERKTKGEKMNQVMVKLNCFQAIHKISLIVIVPNHYVTKLV